MEDEVFENAIPDRIEALPLKAIAIPQNARQIGRGIYALQWPRRKIVDRFQLRLHYYLEAGKIYVDANGDVFPIHEDSIEQTFADDAGYKWLSDFPKRCEALALTQSPSKLIQMRLQLLDLGLRTPPLGLAI